MAKFSLILLGLIGLIVSIILAALIYPFGAFSNFIERIIGYNAGMYTILVLAAIIFLVSLIFLLMGLFAKKKVRALYFHTDYGDIKLTQNMIDQTILRAAKDMNVLKQPEVTTKINSKRKSVHAQVKGGRIPNDHLPDASKQMQQHIESQLKNLLQLEKVHVDVRMEERTADKKTKNAARVV